MTLLLTADAATPGPLRQYLTEQQDADSREAAIATNLAMELMGTYQRVRSGSGR